MRYDLTFFLCCCKSFLGSDDADDDDNNDYYKLLDLDRDASPEEIKRAYRVQSLKYHPDKLAQRGVAVTAEAQAKFTHMKHAYEILSDPYKRETYDAVGAKGLKYMEEPFSMDPQELAHNFAKSSVLDRSKIFAIFVCIAVSVLIQPILICLHVDGKFGDNASWCATLTPLWLWNAFLCFYHTRVILMGPIARPDHIPEAEWVDPLPMKKRILSMLRFLLIVLFEVLAALKLDQVLSTSWAVIFIPLYVWEGSTFYKKWPLACMRIVTVEDLEATLGKPFSEFTNTEKELIGQRYSVVSSTSSPDFDVAQKLKSRARQDIIKSVFRIAFCVVLVFQLDSGNNWNWWFVFAPFWIISIIICYSNYQAFADVQKMAAEKDPTLFSPSQTETTVGATQYGAVGDAVSGQQSTLTPEERAELKAQVMASSSRICSQCCSQGFFLIIVFFFVGKLQGAGFSSFLIISPFIAIAGIILCCIGCAIFGVTEVPTDGIDFEDGAFAYHSAEQGQAPGGISATSTTQPTAFVPMPQPTMSEPVVIPVPIHPPTEAAVAPVVTVPKEPPQEQASQIPSSDDTRLDDDRPQKAKGEIEGQDSEPGEIHELD